MSYLKPNTAGVYDIPSCNVSSQLYIKGRRFESYINELTGADIFEQQEIDELKALVQYLDTTGLNSAWLVDNNNKNADLKTAITALQNKLANIDTTGLTLTSVLNDTNRNSVLKTRLDTTDGSFNTLQIRLDTTDSSLNTLKTRVDTLDVSFNTLQSRLNTTDASLNTLKTRVDTLDVSFNNLDGKTRYVSSVQGNNTAPKIASDFQVAINDRDKRSIYLTTGGNFISSINDSTNQATPGNYSDNNITLASSNGMITTTSHLNRLQGSTIEITAPTGMGVQADTTIKIGQGGSLIEIGSIDTPELLGSNTRIKLGKRSQTRNTEITLAGNILVANARFTELAVSQALTYNNLIALIPTVGLPLWVSSQILTSIIPNYVYSDFLKMKGTVTKDGDIETSQSAGIKALTIYDPTVDVSIFPKVTTFLATGDSSETILTGSIRKQVFNGEILLRNNNIVSTNINWATTDSMDKVNALKLSNNDVELVAGAGATNSELRISNTTGGRIRLRAGTNTGLQANAHDALQIISNQGASTQVVIAGNDAPSGFDNSSKLLVDHQNLNNGIKVTNHQNALITRVNHNNVNTPSLTLQSNWNGSTSKSLYLNANDELYYNGSKVNMGGAGFGGITYYVALPNNITHVGGGNTNQVMTKLYTSIPQRVITQAIGANTAYFLGDYTTETINKVANPILSGVQQLNQYVTWNSQNQVGKLYGNLYYRSITPVNNVMWEKKYTNPVVSNYGTTINGTPIIIPPSSLGIYLISVPRVQWQFIDVIPDAGQTAYITVRSEALINGVWTTQQTWPHIPPSYNTTQTGLTLLFINFLFFTQQLGAAPLHTAFRFSLVCTNGTIRQTTAGAAVDAGAYQLLTSPDQEGGFEVLLKAGGNNKVITPYSTTPTLIELDMPIDTPYDISSFNNSKLKIDMIFIQETGGFSGHEIKLWFNEGSITHFHSTIAETGQITDILSGTNMSVSNNGLGAYTINNAAPVQNVTTSGNLGLSIANNTAALTNTAPVQNVSVSGNLGLSIANNTAALTNTAPVQNVTVSGNLGVSIANNAAALTNTAPVQDAVAGSAIYVTKANGVATITNAGVWNITAGTGISTNAMSGAVTITNSAVVQDVAASTGISVSKANGLATITNSGVTSVSGGTGITVSAASGAVTIAASGLTAVAAGTGINISTVNQTSTITNTGITSVTAGDGMQVVTTSGVAKVTQNSRQADMIATKIGSTQRKPDWYGVAWSQQPIYTHSPLDVYISGSGKVIAYVNGNQADRGILYSTNYGTSYSETPQATYRGWHTICGSTTGDVIWMFSNDVMTQTGRIYYNTIAYTIDYFANITYQTGGNTTGFFGGHNNYIPNMRCTGDGKTVVCTEHGPQGWAYLRIPQIFIGRNYGQNWSVVILSYDYGITNGIAMSADGKYIYVAVDGTSFDSRPNTGTGGVWRSMDYGATFTQIRSAAKTYQVECDATGQIVMFVDSTEYGQLSWNYGDNWHNHTNQYGGLWTCAISASGAIMWAGYYGGDFTKSVDYGKTWQHGVTPIGSWQWFGVSCLACNNDGSIVVAGSVAGLGLLGQYREYPAEVRSIQEPSGAGGVSITSLGGGAYALDTNTIKVSLAKPLSSPVSIALTFNFPAINLNTHRIRGVATLYVLPPFNYGCIRLNDLGALNTASNLNEQSYNMGSFYIYPQTNGGGSHQFGYQDRSLVFSSAVIADPCRIVISFEIMQIRLFGSQEYSTICKGSYSVTGKWNDQSPFYKAYGWFERYTEISDQQLTSITFAPYNGTSASILERSNIDFEAIPIKTNTPI